jgi:hypothetical protein
LRHWIWRVPGEDDRPWLLLARLLLSSRRKKKIDTAC